MDRPGKHTFPLANGTRTDQANDNDNILILLNIVLLEACMVWGKCKYFEMQFSFSIFRIWPCDHNTLFQGKLSP